MKIPPGAKVLTTRLDLPRAGRPRYAKAGPPRDASDTRNTGERRYADEVLDVEKRAGTIREYWFEGIKLRLGANLHITPDYLVLMDDWTIELREVKGRKGDGPFVREDAWVKLKAAAHQYPFKIAVVWPKRGNGWMRKEL